MEQEVALGEDGFLFSLSPFIPGGPSACTGHSMRRLSFSNSMKSYYGLFDTGCKTSCFHGTTFTKRAHPLLKEDSSLVQLTRQREGLKKKKKRRPWDRSVFPPRGKDGSTELPPCQSSQSVRWSCCGGGGGSLWPPLSCFLRTLYRLFEDGVCVYVLSQISLFVFSRCGQWSSQRM